MKEESVRMDFESTREASVLMNGTKTIVQIRQNDESADDE